MCSAIEILTRDSDEHLAEARTLMGGSFTDEECVTDRLDLAPGRNAAGA